MAQPPGQAFQHQHTPAPPDQAAVIQQHMQQPPTRQSSSKLLLALGMTRTSSGTVLPGPCISRHTLLLSPASLEQRFWSSVKVLRLLDSVGLFNSVMLNVMLMRKFGLGTNKPDMLWHFVPVLLYLTAGLAQLAVLLLRPELHQRHRFGINLANRLVKAVTVTWAAINMGQTDVMSSFAGTLNSVPHAAAGEASTTTYMTILRTVASLPLLWVSHGVNFILPFWLLLPLQLYTLLAVSRVVPSIVCVLLGQPLHILHPAAVIATHVHGVVKALIALAVPVPCKWPWQQAASSDAAASVVLDPLSPDSAAKDLLVLVTVTFTMVLLVIPCAVAYNVELMWKKDFLKSHIRSSETSSSLEAGSSQTCVRVSPMWVTFDIVCLTLLVCESIVQLAPPLQCDCELGH